MERLSTRPARARTTGAATARVAIAVTGAALLCAAVLSVRPTASAGPAVAPTLTPADVTDLVSRCVSSSKRVRGRPNLTIAVVDREGNSLGVFHMARSKGSLSIALSKAATATYFSSDQGSFTTRTAAYIIQDHFPPGVRFAPGGPLYGVEFSSLGGSDVNPIFFKAGVAPDALPGLLAIRTVMGHPTDGVVDPLAGVKLVADMRIRGDLGGVAVYKNGRRVGGIGVDDGRSRSQITVPASRLFPSLDGSRPPKPRKNYRLTFRNEEKARRLERIVMSAAQGRLIARTKRADRITLDGFALPYNRPVALKNRPAPTISVPGDGVWDVDFPLTDGSPIPSRFTDVVLTPPATAGSGAQDFAGQMPDRYLPLATNFPAAAAPDGTPGPTEAEVRRILWQGAQRANITRGAIRRPIGLAMQCWISVVDVEGKVLGVFRFREDATTFSYDVSVQKARTAVLFSDDKAAFSCRAIGQFSQGFYPAGQQHARRGPLHQLQDGISVALLTGALGPSGSPPGTAATPLLASGITIFPGGVPLYRNGTLIGGVGISGDGVDQDDIVADFASRGFGAPKPIRCDALSGPKLKAGLGRALDRLEALTKVRPTPFPAPFTVDDIGGHFYSARLNRARVRLRKTALTVGPPYVKYPRHPGPVTIR